METTTGLPHHWVTQQPCFRGLECPSSGGEQDLGLRSAGKMTAFFLDGIDKQALAGEQYFTFLSEVAPCCRILYRTVGTPSRTSFSVAM